VRERRGVRAGVAAAVVLAGLTLAACGSGGSSGAPSTTTSSPVHPSLCAQVALVSRVHVVRDAPSAGHFEFPANVTLTRAPLVRRIAEALCALPRLPRLIACPAEFAVDYHLSFAVLGAETEEFAVQFNPTGCEIVRGLGRARWLAFDPGFFRLLGRALGLAHPSRRSFLGTATPGG
jgi:hypothetical protein